MPFLKYKRLKLKLRVFSAGHSVAMVTYSVTKIIPTSADFAAALTHFTRVGLDYLKFTSSKSFCEMTSGVTVKTVGDDSWRS